MGSRKGHRPIHGNGKKKTCLHQVCNNFMVITLNLHNKMIQWTYHKSNSKWHVRNGNFKLKYIFPTSSVEDDANFQQKRLGRLLAPLKKQLSRNAGKDSLYWPVEVERMNHIKLVSHVQKKQKNQANQLLIHRLCGSKIMGFYFALSSTNWWGSSFYLAWEICQQGSRTGQEYRYIMSRPCIWKEKRTWTLKAVDLHKRKGQKSVFQYDNIGYLDNQIYS